MKTLILTPNKNEVCGMYQLAKDLAKEFNGDIHTKVDTDYYTCEEYDQVITLLYPMHQRGKEAKRDFGKKWIVYNQQIPPVTKDYFPNFFRRQYMKWFNYVNSKSMVGADEYWLLQEREQKPRWTKRCPLKSDKEFYEYALYLGRTTDYKNFKWLEKTLFDLNIILEHPENVSDDEVYYYLSNATLLVTASTWEGYGRPVMEAQALDIPVVCFDTGVHKKLVKKGFVVPNGDFKMFKEKLKEAWQIYSATQSKEDIISV